MSDNVVIRWGDFARDIILVRSRKGQSLRGLSKSLGVDKSTMCRAEQGQPINAENLILICKRLRLDPFNYLSVPTNPITEGE